MTRRHTPGPWNADTQARVIHPHPQANPDSTIGRLVCTVDGRYVETGEPSDEALANARLIAAAPDMLALLGECREVLGDLHEILAHYHKTALPENESHEDVCENPDCCGHCKARKASGTLLARLDAQLAEPGSEAPNRRIGL